MKMLHFVVKEHRLDHTWATFYVRKMGHSCGYTAEFSKVADVAGGIARAHLATLSNEQKYNIPTMLADPTSVKVVELGDQPFDTIKQYIPLDWRIEKIVKYLSGRSKSRDAFYKGFMMMTTPNHIERCNMLYSDMNLLVQVVNNGKVYVAEMYKNADFQFTRGLSLHDGGHLMTLMDNEVNMCCYLMIKYALKYIIFYQNNTKKGTVNIGRITADDLNTLEVYEIDLSKFVEFTVVARSGRNPLISDEQWEAPVMIRRQEFVLA